MRTVLVSCAFLLVSGAAWAGDPGVGDTEVKVGDVNIMSGPAAFVGSGFSLGSKIAAAEINAAGGINGRKLVVVTEDDGYIPSRSFQALTKLIEVDHIFRAQQDLRNGERDGDDAADPRRTRASPTLVTEAPASLVYNPVRPSVFTFGANYSDAFYAQLKPITIW